MLLHSVGQRFRRSAFLARLFIRWKSIGTFFKVASDEVKGIV